MGIKKEVKPIYVILFSIIALVSYFVPLDVSPEAKIVFSVLVMAFLFWLSEAIPLYLTSLLLSLILVLFKVFTLKVALTKFADSILILIFAGFLIAKVMQKQKLDKRIAIAIVKRLNTPKYVLLALMFTTAFFSMWMTNTATTFIMIPIGIAIVKKGKKATGFTKAAVLGIAYSANIGGIGTIIGTPPNAIAVSQLGELAAINVSFLSWMLHALPLVLILVPLAWLILIFVFPFKQAKVKKVKMGVAKEFSAKDKLFFAIFGATVLLWLTTELHGFSATFIALSGVFFLFFSGLLNRKDINTLSWDTLILFGGGLVLGAAMFETGLSQYMASQLGGILSGLPIFVIIAGVVIFAMTISSFISNTATAAIIIPVLLPLAPILGIEPKVLALIAGMSVSLNFIMPIGTPPNAIAYSAGKLRMRDMFKAGGLLGIVTVVVLTAVSYLFW